MILTFAYCLSPFDKLIQNLVKREQISLKIPLNKHSLRISPYSVRMWENADRRTSNKDSFYAAKDWKLFSLECSSKLTLEPNEKQRSVHIGDSVTVTCIGPGIYGRTSTLLNWEFINKSKSPANMKTSSGDIHTKEEICDVEKLDILGFKKENEGDYRCIQKKNHLPQAVRSHADVRIVMIGKGSFYLLHFKSSCCKNSSNYHKAILFLFVCNIQYFVQ